MVIKAFLDHVIVQMMERVKENSKVCLDSGQGGGKVLYAQRGTLVLLQGQEKAVELL